MIRGRLFELEVLGVFPAILFQRFEIGVQHGLQAA